MTDEKIIKLYFDRDERAISVTKNKYGKYLYTIAYNILQTKEDSEESVNDTYLGAWSTIPPKKPNVLKTYLAKLTRNISIKKLSYNHAQKRGGTQSTFALDELRCIVNSADSVEVKIERELLLEFIKRFISELPTDQRQIFVARYWYIYSVKDISRKLGFSESKVKTTLMRTRDKLSNELRKEGLI